MWIRWINRCISSFHATNPQLNMWITYVCSGPEKHGLSENLYKIHKHPLTQMSKIAADYSAAIIIYFYYTKYILNLENSSDRKDGTICRIGDNDTVFDVDACTICPLPT